MKSKSLVKKMIHSEVIDYILKHPEYKIVSIDEAQTLSAEECVHDEFWLEEPYDGYYVFYSKKIQKFDISHPNIQRNVILIERES